MDQPDLCRIPWPDDDAAIRRAVYWIAGKRHTQPPPKTRADLRRQEAQILEDEYDAIQTRIGALVLENAPQIVLVAATAQARMIFCWLIEAWQEYARENELVAQRAKEKRSSHTPSDRDYMAYAVDRVRATWHRGYARELRAQGRYTEALQHDAEELRLYYQCQSRLGITYDGLHGQDISHSEPEP